ncbi:MAG: hypothetical protein Q8R92_14570 [Deltaproteobacteria bacterium]|nr:hypothetical protein [Deltaproteobacteria bacterium]
MEAKMRWSFLAFVLWACGAFALWRLTDSVTMTLLLAVGSPLVLGLLFWRMASRTLGEIIKKERLKQDREMK